MKACRKLLEEDLGLPEKSLADRKDFIQKYVDKVTGAHQHHVCDILSMLLLAYLGHKIALSHTLYVDLLLLCTDYSQQSI